SHALSLSSALNSELNLRPRPVKLFMFYIGGNCGNSNIELHDVRFSIGESPEDCYDDLRRQWWGEPKSLHLDCWGIVEQADGYDVTLTDNELNEAAPKHA